MQMWKSWSAIGGVIAVCCTTMPSHVDAASAHKLGYVNVKAALRELGDAVDAKKRLSKRKTLFQKRLVLQQNKLRKERAAFRTKSAKLKGVERRKAMMRLQQKFMMLRRAYMGLSKTLARMEASEMKRIMERLRPIAEQLRKQKKLSMLFTAQSGILAADPKLDYTNQLICMYNSKFGGSKAACSRKQGSPPPALRAPKTKKSKTTSSTDLPTDGNDPFGIQ